MEHRDHDTNEDRDSGPPKETAFYTLGELFIQAVLVGGIWTVVWFVGTNVSKYVEALRAGTGFDWRNLSAEDWVLIGGVAVVAFGVLALRNSQRLWKVEGWSPRVLGNIVLGVMTLVSGVGLLLGLFFSI